MIQEKFDLDLGILNKRHQNKNKDLEDEFEEKFQNEKDAITKQFYYTYEVNENLNKKNQSEILCEYEKKLEEEYILSTRAIIDEYEEKNKSEIDSIFSKMKIENNQSSIEINKGIEMQEKLYYSGYFSLI